jgi:hypothetical protein
MSSGERCRVLSSFEGTTFALLPSALRKQQLVRMTVTA